MVGAAAATPISGPLTPDYCKAVLDKVSRGAGWLVKEGQAGDTCLVLVTCIPAVRSRHLRANNAPGMLLGRCSQPSKCPVLASGRPMTMSVRPSNNKHTHHPRARSDHEYTGDRFSYSTLPLITSVVVPVSPVSHPVALQNLYRIFYPTTNDPQYSLLRSAANPWEAAVCPLTP
jgi:hypothetical protein